MIEIVAHILVRVLTSSEETFTYFEIDFDTNLKNVVRIRVVICNI